MSSEGVPSPLFVLRLRGNRPLCFALASSTWGRGLCRILTQEALEPEQLSWTHGYHVLSGGRRS